MRMGYYALLASFERCAGASRFPRSQHLPRRSLARAGPRLTIDLRSSAAPLRPHYRVRGIVVRLGPRLKAIDQGLMGLEPTIPCLQSNAEEEFDQR